MLKKLILENWKSFRYAELPIDPLTVLIGTNASGKSNAIEALEFLSRLARGEAVLTALLGDTKLSPIRGGVELATFKPYNTLTLKVVFEGEESTDYRYSITVKTVPNIQIQSEFLEKIPSNPESTQEAVQIFPIDKVQRDLIESELSPLFYTQENRFGMKIHLLDDSYSVLNRLSHLRPNLDDVQRVSQKLIDILILNPIPSSMRSYSMRSDQLMNDASNIAGVLVALPDEEKTYVESTISSYVAHLPEKDIQKVWAEPVGRLGSDAMLYCEEAWVSGEPPIIVDARGMSDGTLRFIAILTALLTRPEGSQLVIEEVDAGLHPSRAELLLRMLREIGEKRKIDILVTTHNPALLNALGLGMAPFVIVAHRDPQTGESKLTPLDDIKHLPKLLASGSIGDLATRGTLEKVLSQTS